MNNFKDRIKELRRVKAKTLLNNPLNWRVHTEEQKSLLRHVIDDIGFANALVARENVNGELVLIDGHLRAEMNPEQFVPVLVVDVTEKEADKLLFFIDPISQMAKTNVTVLEELIDNIEIDVQSTKLVLDTLEKEAKTHFNDVVKNNKPIVIQDIFQVVIECSNEMEQKSLFDEMVSKGLKCKLLTL